MIDIELLNMVHESLKRNQSKQAVLNREYLKLIKIEAKVRHGMDLTPKERGVLSNEKE